MGGRLALKSFLRFDNVGGIQEYLIILNPGFHFPTNKIWWISEVKVMQGDYW